jgi:hypothetical protein
MWTVTYGRAASTSRDLFANLRYTCVRYTRHYHKLQGAELLTDLLNDPKVQEAFQVGRALPTAQLCPVEGAPDRATLQRTQPPHTSLHRAACRSRRSC